MIGEHYKLYGPGWYDAYWNGNTDGVKEYHKWVVERIVELPAHAIETPS